MRRHAIGNRLLTALAMAVPAGVFEWLAVNKSGFADTYVDTIYPELVRTVGRAMSVFPFSVVEILMYVFILIILGLLVTTVGKMVRVWIPGKNGEFGGGKAARKHGASGKQAASGKHEASGKHGSSGKREAPGKRGPGGHVYGQGSRGKRAAGIFGLFLSDLVVAAAFLFLLYVAGCGINYHASSFAKTENLKTGTYTEEQLKELCLFLTDEINATCAEMTWTEDGTYILPENAVAEAKEAMEKLGTEYESLSGYYPDPKPVLVSRILTVQLVTGVYSPFTIEANYNREMPDYEIPSTVCHELSHLKGFMREQEAGFLAYLGCMESDDPAIRFSGEMHAYSYAMNAYYRYYGSSKYSEIYSLLDERAAGAWRDGSNFWRSYEGTVSEVHDKVNDTYLKANNQSSGSRSYGQMVDLLIAMMEQGRLK